MAATKRHPLLPEVKTVEEIGVPGVDSDNWYALFAAKGIPAAEIDRVYQALQRTPAELAALLKNDTAKWTRVVKAKNIQPD